MERPPPARWSTTTAGPASCPTLRTAPSAWCASSATLGKLEKGEDPFEAAKRELEEECGLTADKYTSLGEFYPTVGYDTEIIYTWVATGLHETRMHLDADEFLTPDRVPLAQAYEMVMRGEIKDGKTIAGVLKLKALLDEGKL